MTNNNKKPEKQSEWKRLIHEFVGNFLEQIGENVSYKVHRFFSQLKKKSIGGLLLSIGAIFILVGIVLFVNTFFPGSEFAGWILGGLVLFVVGYFLVKG